MGGILGDRLGPRIVISCGISIVAVSAFSRGFMSNYTGLLILNLFLGIGMGLTMPNLPKLTAGWFQPAQRGIVMSIYSTGISTGAYLD